MLFFRNENIERWFFCENEREDKQREELVQKLSTE